MRQRVRVSFATAVVAAVLVLVAPRAWARPAIPADSGARVIELEKKVAELHDKLKALEGKDVEALQKEVEAAAAKRSEALAGIARHEHDATLWRVLGVIGVATAIVFIWRGVVEKDVALAKAEADKEKSKASIRRSEMAAAARMWRSLAAPKNQGAPDSLAVLKAYLEGLTTTLKKASADAMSTLDEVEKRMEKK